MGGPAERASGPGVGSDEPDRVPRMVVVAPSLLITVTIERAPDGQDEIHQHPGGQGFWVARMASALGGRVRLCSVIGGESGHVLAALLDHHDVALDAVGASQTTPAYVDDRRAEDRNRVAESPAPPLGRHEVDELYAMALGAGLDADAVLLTGPRRENEISNDFYARLAHDLSSQGVLVAADVSEHAVGAVAEGRPAFVKVADSQLVGAGFATGGERGQLLRGIERLREAGVENVLVSCSDRPSIASIEEHLWELSFPRFEVRDAHGTGDSIFAAVSTELARGTSWEDALRTGISAGSLNVTRRGLATGHHEDVASLARRVKIRAL
jgi:1-phosphofructokinase